MNFWSTLSSPLQVVSASKKDEAEAEQLGEGAALGRVGREVLSEKATFC